MNEIEVNAKFAMLIEQRNSAMNQVVNLAGELTSVRAQLEAVQALLAKHSEVAEEETHG